MVKILTKLDIEKIFFILLVVSFGTSLALIINSYIEMRFFTLPEVSKHESSSIKKVEKENRSYTGMVYVFETEEKAEPEEFEVKGQERKESEKVVETAKDIKLIGVINFNGKKVALLKTKKGTALVKKDDLVDGYRIISIEDFSLMMKKNGKIYRLTVNIGSGSVKSSRIYKKTEKVSKADSEVIKIDRRFVEEKTADIGTLLKDVLIVPEIKNNETIGFRFRYVKPQSLLYKFGLRSGDLIISINDMPVRTAEEAFKIYNMLRNEQFIKLVIERNGKRKVITYEIR
ncbi:MAG TPA: hypothetical protein DEP48_05400 [Persephonella sp.]|uniref:PDZ domain-containing protein n=1 Tax=Persephonella marina (strain DSM 14350 / EX-H1) TaxID=123214 RepID=C0QPL3_PERMH|nr:MULTISPECIES: PDZ domain-containing protein [Persephonella]ACO03081.1 conserved hypothetical protein [Persephonella marina EX-H1]HCB69776.1 hypothetical protein [Persephonella sp.]